MSNPSAMAPDAFVDLARQILAERGVDRSHGPGRVYEDDRVIIRSHYNGLDLEITRKAMPDVAKFLVGTNPTTMAKGGQVIRHHGEHAYITGHLRSLMNDGSAS